MLKVIFALVALLVSGCGGGSSNADSNSSDSYQSNDINDSAEQNETNPSDSNNNSGGEVTIISSEAIGVVGSQYSISWTTGNSATCFLNGAVQETVTADGSVVVTPNTEGVITTSIECDAQTAEITVNILPEFIVIPDANFADVLNRIGYTVDNGKMSAETALSIEKLCITSMPGYYGEADSNNTAIFTNYNVPDGGVRCGYTSDYITDVSGLDFFLNLKTMRLEWQQISEINLSSLTNLTFLSLWANPLTDLDVTKNVELTHLGLSETSLTAIDTSTLTKLEEAAFQHGYDVAALPVTLSNGTVIYGFSSIDFSENQNLKRIYLHGNPMRDVDLVPNNTIFTDFWATDTNIETLDLSNYQNLWMVNLQNSANLNYLDLTGVDLPGRLFLTDCPNLYQVFVSDPDQYIAAVETPDNGIQADDHITFVVKP